MVHKTAAAPAGIFGANWRMKTVEPESTDPRATLLACAAIVAFLGLAVLGFAALIGAVGFGLFQLWS